MTLLLGEGYQASLFPESKYSKLIKLFIIKCYIRLDFKSSYIYLFLTTFNSMK